MFRADRETLVTERDTGDTRRTGQRLEFLDALRGLAAVYVVLFHLRYVGDVPVPSSLSGFVDLGGSGVMLFFVVSCFSLFYTMPARLKQSRPLLSFYLHRLFRIAPLFYVWLVVEFLSNRLYYGNYISPTEVLHSVFFIFNLVPGRQEGIVKASWTIGVEMLFYVLFPLIYFTTKTITHAVALVVGTMLLYIIYLHVLVRLPFRTETIESYAFWFFIKDIPIFALGAVCFFVVKSRVLHRLDVSHDRALGVLFILIGVYVMIARSSNWISDRIFDGHPYIWPAVGYSLMLLGLSLYPLRLVVNSCTRFLGNISYSVYLAHAPVIYFLQPTFTRIVDSLGPRLGAVTCLAMTFALVIPIAYVTYRLVELPGIKAGKACYARLVQVRGIRPARRSTEPQDTPDAATV
jgi:peptidoglycan/LPS O-acetylase OafA/YrhL